jgi:hypothetical protein
MFKTCCIISVLFSTKCHLFHNFIVFFSSNTFFINTHPSRIKVKVRVNLTSLVDKVESFLCGVHVFHFCVGFMCSFFVLGSCVPFLCWVHVFHFCVGFMCSIFVLGSCVPFLCWVHVFHFCATGFMWNFTSVLGSIAAFKRTCPQVLVSDHTAAMSLWAPRLWYVWFCRFFDNGA